jgi:6-phosphogluconolactonase
LKELEMTKRTASIQAACLALAALCAMPAVAKTDLVYFGSHGAGGPPGHPPKPDAVNGIWAARFDDVTGQLSPLGRVTLLDRPTWIVVNPEKPIIYSVNELGNAPGQDGQVVAYAVDPASGALREINRVDAGGGGTTHLAFDQVTQTIFTANFGSGHVTAIAVKPDGSLGEVASKQQDFGHGPSRRQTTPHAHAVAVDPTHQYVLAPDLGADRMFVYHFDDATRALSPANPAYVQFPPGTGPRHVVFSPSGRFAYLITELSAELNVFAWDAKQGQLKLVQTLSSVPADFKGERSGAEIAVSHDGRFLYLSNRSDSTIDSYRIDAASGRLTPLQRIAAGGQNPWSFGIDPTGRWMLVTNETSSQVAVFKIDPRSGAVSATGNTMAMEHPVSATFFTQTGD